jgi:glycosyltransferase involved in cell wall biosynthesis
MKVSRAGRMAADQGIHPLSGEGRQILFLSSSRFPTNKAYGYQIVRECESLALLGMDVTLIFPALAPRQARNMGVARQPDLMASYSLKRKFPVQAVPVASGWDIFYSDTSPLWSLGKILWFAVRSGGIVKRFRKRGQAVIWTQDLPVLLVQVFGGTAPGDILLYECHDIPRRLFGFLSRWIRKLTGVIVTTSGLKAEFVKIGFPGERILVLPNAVDRQEFAISEGRDSCRRRFGLPLRRPIVGYIGKFQTYGREKGIATLVRSAEYLIRGSSALPLILLVGGPLDAAAAYCRVADEIGIPREILRVVDFQPRADVPQWMKACDVCVIPFPAKGHFVDFACPMKLFEYLAAGVPVVASDLPAIRDVIRDGVNGVLVPADDPRALAAGITRILSDRAFGKRLARNGLQTVRGNSWERRSARALAFMTGENRLLEKVS